MDTEKQSEESWEESEQLGPYQLQEQVPQTGRGQGELYRAKNETSGATALVLKPAATEGQVPLTDWRVRCVSSASPGYVAVEVEHSPWSVAPDKHSVESLVCMFEGVRDGMRRMALALSVSNEPRLRWRPGLAVAGAAAVCALAFALVHLASQSHPSGSPDAMARAEPAPMRDEVTTDTAMPPMGNWLFTDTPDGGSSAVAGLPIPSKPYKGQRRPPCKPRVETEINGGCWVPHKLTAPCPDDLYEYQGQCYSVSGQTQPPPQALEP